MNLGWIRKDFTDNSTIGDFLIDGKFFSYALGDKDRQVQADGSIIPWRRELKIPDETAIPYGVYEVITNFSNRFKKVMPLLLHVDGFEGIRIHAGNDRDDTEGCILLGYIKAKDFVGQSRAAFGYFMPILILGLEEGKVFLTITKA